MKLNDKKIRVVMLYSDEVVFTTGDIVFNNANYLYKCVQDQPQMGTGIVTPYFEPYLDASLDQVISDSNTFEQNTTSNRPISAGLVYQYINSHFQGYSNQGAIIDYPEDDILDCTVNSRYIIPSTGEIQNLPTVINRSWLNVLDVVVIGENTYYQITSIDTTDNVFSIYLKTSAENDWMTYDITNYQQNAQQIITASTDNYTQNTAVLNQLITDISTKVGKIKVFESSAAANNFTLSIFDPSLTDSLYEFHIHEVRGYLKSTTISYEDIAYLLEDPTQTIDIYNIGTLQATDDGDITLSTNTNIDLKIYRI